MAKCRTNLKSALKNSDLFGIPVELTYRGETTFNTICGGFLSILMIIGFTIYFALELHSEYYEPRFLTSPTTYDSRDKHAFMTPSLGNTVAMAIDPKLHDVRVAF